MSIIIDTITAYLPTKRKHTSGGWISVNAVCCDHNGTSKDTRGRGGILINHAISWHCFNCGFKTSWKPGRHLSGKFIKLLKWLNVPDDDITQCRLEALKIQETEFSEDGNLLLPTFTEFKIPKEWVLLRHAPYGYDENIDAIFDYLFSRNIEFNWYNWYYNPEEPNKLIIPCYHEHRCIGYNARSIDGSSPKYLNKTQQGYLFNIDKQHYDRKFVIVCEGILDAICVDGVAVLHGVVSKSQKRTINMLQRDVIVVPDRDESGKKLVAQAIENEWYVSMPDWEPGIKDITDAVSKIGRLATLHRILTNVERTSLKIKLKERSWFKQRTEDDN